MKILILGGLGYVGSALSELYATSPEHEIILADTAFVPERIAGLPPHISYVQADIADLDLMRHLMARVDVVHLLAAQVEAESSVHRETAIWRDNFDLPRALIEACPPTTRMMFPSSGNVFGGIDESGKYLDLNEEDAPAPKYPYAETKREMEKFLLKSNRDHVIIRFGTNYGYSPGIRFNLVTNNFTRRAIRGEPITIHGDGSNYRPTACVRDCARALDFLSRRNDASGEIFHVVNESLRIRDLASLIISTLDADAPLEFVAKEVPFSAYGLSSAKIRALGFDFEWNIERAVLHMRQVFSGLRSAAEFSAAPPA